MQSSPVPYSQSGKPKNPNIDNRGINAKTGAKVGPAPVPTGGLLGTAVTGLKTRAQRIDEAGGYAMGGMVTPRGKDKDKKKDKSKGRDRRK